MPSRVGESPLSPVRLLELDADRPDEALEGLAGYVAVEALVRRRGEPVGWVRLPVAEGRCPAAEIREALDRIAPSLPGAAVADPGAAGAPPSVTVAVCTRDRAADLARCLRSLERLDYPGLDLLVVDNAPSSEATRAEVARHPRVRYVREPRPGLDWARNRAIAEATGEILIFTDDDVELDAGWIGAIVAAFGQDRRVAAVTGLVVPGELETDAQVLFERYRSFGRGFTPRRVESGDVPGMARRYGAAGDYGTGANMAFRREVFARIGPFDPALDVGTPARGGGDLEMFFRVLKHGYALVYEPRAIVRHRHRRSLAELQRQIEDHGVSFSAYMVRSAWAHSDERLAFVRLACWWYLKTAFRILWPKAEPAGPLRRLGIAELRGCVVGLTRYPVSRRAAARVAALTYPETVHE